MGSNFIFLLQFLALQYRHRIVPRCRDLPLSTGEPNAHPATDDEIPPLLPAAQEAIDHATAGKIPSFPPVT